MAANEFNDFRLVGGTALSLYLGHRMSVDLDLFTDAPYGSIDFGVIETYLKRSFAYVEGNFGGNPGMGKSFIIGTDIKNVVKLDIFYAMDPFFQEVVTEENIRLASIEDLIAMKVDIIQRTGRKKDFWDLHELLGRYTINDMIALHATRFEWTHNAQLIRYNFTMFAEADLEPDPICLREKEWIFIMEDIAEAAGIK